MKTYSYIINALIILVIPAAAAFVTQIPGSVLAADTKIVLGLCVNFALAILKAFEYFFKMKENESHAN